MTMRIIDFFDQGVRYHADKPAFVDVESRYSYSQADAEIHRVAGALVGRGVGKGARVGVYSPNANPAWIALLGLMRAECVWLPINPRNSVDVNVDLSLRFGMDVMFYDACFNSEVEAIKEQVPGISQFVCIKGKGNVGMSQGEFVEGQPETHQTGPHTAKELAAIFPTGGTTGQSKGVLMNHEALETFAANYYTHFNYREDSVHLVVAPMTHSAGIMGCLHFMRGGCNVITKQVDPLSIMQDIEQHSVTHLFLPPTVLYMMLAHEQVRDFEYSSLQHFIVGAAPTSLEKLKEAIEIFGPVMTEAYGQTEAPAAITLKAPWDYIDADGNIDDERLAGIGRPAAFSPVKILGEDGNEVPRGEPGEICVSGRLVTLGYLDNAEATAEAHRNGWLWTGDVGVMSDDGYVRIVDRSKDMIISGGFNIYPNEVEQVISELPEIQEVAVIGVPDDKWGEAVKAIIQLRPGQELDSEAVINLVKERLGSVKAPKTVDFIDDLPRSPNGKVLKTALRKPYWQDKGRAVN
ncbi:MAG: AMP-binding protein [Parasphingorhabdus sp.]